MSELIKDYYNIEEALKKISNAGITLTQDDLYHYGERGKLKFCLYISSRPVLAMTTLSGERYFIGHCLLHGIYKLDLENLLPILTRVDGHLIQMLNARFFWEQPVLSDWSMLLPDDIQKADLSIKEMWRPAPEKYKPVIEIYYIKPRYFLQFTTEKEHRSIDWSHIPDHGVSSARLCGGTTSQYPDRQLFKKDNLCILHEDLTSFITLLKNSKREDKGGTDSQVPLQSLEVTKLSRELPDEAKWLIASNAKDRHQHWQRRAEEIKKIDATITKKQVAKQIYQEQKSLVEKYDLLSHAKLKLSETNIEHVITQVWPAKLSDEKDKN